MEAEFHKCSTLNTLKNYINVHKNDVNNPFLQQAKDKLDDMTFNGFRNAEDYKQYMSNFPSGRHVMQAKTAIKDSTYRAPISHSTSSGPSSDEIWEFAKKAIGVIAILAALVMIYLWLTDEVKGSMVAAFIVVIVGPICKWAFDD